MHFTSLLVALAASSATLGAHASAIDRRSPSPAAAPEPAPPAPWTNHTIKPRLVYDADGDAPMVGKLLVRRKTDKNKSKWSNEHKSGAPGQTKKYFAVAPPPVERTRDGLLAAGVIMLDTDAICGSKAGYLGRIRIQSSDDDDDDDDTNSGKGKRDGTLEKRDFWSDYVFFLCRIGGACRS